MKYYFVHYWLHLSVSGWYPVGEAIDKHPIVYMAEDIADYMRHNLIADSQLAGWQEITKEDYEIWRQANGLSY